MSLFAGSVRPDGLRILNASLEVSFKIRKVF